MNFGLIGAGKVSRHHLDAMKAIPEISITGITSRSLTRAEQLAKEYDIPVYMSWQDMLDDPEIDAVDIITLPESHAEISITAAEKGKHILLEKPMAVSVTEAKTILEAVNKHHVQLAVNLQYRHSDGAREIQRAVSHGRLGRLIQGDVYVKWYRPPSYFMPPGKGTWLGEGGGVLMTQAIHMIDLLLWHMGPVASLFANVQLGCSHKIEVEDNASVLLKFTNGALGVVQASTCMYPGTPDRLEIHGERGTVALEAGNIIRWDVAGEETFGKQVCKEVKNTSGASDPMAIPVENFRRSILDLIKSIDNDQPPIVSGGQARYTQEVIEAMYQSGKNNELVKLMLNDIENI